MIRAGVATVLVEGKSPVTARRPAEVMAFSRDLASVLTPIRSGGTHAAVEKRAGPLR